MQTELRAGFRAVPNGNHSGIDPLFVPDGYVAAAVNADFRRGVVQTRPDFNRIRSFVLDEKYRERRFQGALAYTYDEKPHIIFGLGGDVFTFDVDLGIMHRITDEVPKLSHAVQRFSFLDTGTYIIVQDGLNTPIIVEGTGARLSDPNKDSPLLELPGEIATGTHMAFVYGRIALALTDSPAFMIGDVAIPLRYPDNYLFFAENQYLQGAGAFETLGKITALSAWSQIDTPTGIGGLLVFTPDTVEAYDIGTDRRVWGEQPISRVILDRGAVGPNAVVRQNNDVFFRHRDGIYSIRSARAELAQNVFLSYSRFNAKFIEHDDQAALPLVSGALFDKRVLFTCAPYNWVRADDGMFETTFRGVVVFDHDVDEAPRAANEIASGVWTGLDFHQILDLKARTFAFVRGTGGDVQLWEMGGDTGLDDNRSPIPTTVYTPAYDFGDRTARKKLNSVEMWLNDVSGSVSFELAVRADRRDWKVAHQGLVREWTNTDCRPIPATECYPAPTDECALANLQPGSEQQLAFNEFRVDFHALEAKITMTGRAELHVLRLSATPNHDKAKVGSAVNKLEYLPDDYLTYKVPS